MNYATIAEELVSGLAHSLSHEDPDVCSLIAETNAFGWGLDTLQVTDAHLDEDGYLSFSAHVSLTGDQDENKGFNGDAMECEVTGVAKEKDGAWHIESYELEGLELNVQ